MHSVMQSEDTEYYIWRVNRSFREYNYDLILNFNKDITRDLNFKGLLGFMIGKEKRILLYSASTNGGLILPHFFAIANSLNAPEAADRIQSQMR